MEGIWEQFEAAATLRDMAKGLLLPYSSDEVKAGQKFIADGYQEALWRFLDYNREDAKKASRKKIERIVKAMLDTKSIKRIYDLICFLRELGTNWSEELVVEAAEMVVASPHPNVSYQTFFILSQISNLPDDLIKKGMAINQRRGFIYLTSKKNKEMVALLNANLDFWLIDKIPGLTYGFPDYTPGCRLCLSRSGIPVFSQDKWEVIEQTSAGVLLHGFGQNALLHERKAVRIPEGVKTVEVALNAPWVKKNKIKS